MNTPPRVSVGICSYNGAQRLPSLLSALEEQSCPGALWELLVIDNASSDGTGEIAKRFLKQSSRLRGRVVREESPGLSFARRRAAKESAGEFLVFLDDDNLPAKDFLEQVMAAFDERPKAGIIGGRVLPRWEVSPTPLALAVAGFALALCDHGDRPFCYSGVAGGPVGAGLCIRTSVLQQIFGSDRGAVMAMGRKGASLMSGEDTALSVLAKQQGWECWYDPRLSIEHCLPPARMRKSYLLQLHEGIGRGQFVLRQLFDWKARHLILSRLIGLKDLARWIRGWVFGPPASLRRDHPALAQDLHDLQQRLVLGRGLQALNLVDRSS